MILSRTYSNRAEIPQGAGPLYQKHGSLFILTGAKRDFVADNPWEADNWNLTAQGRFVSEHGLPIAEAFAKNAGTMIGALLPKPLRPSVKVLVQRRELVIGTTGSPTGGSSGNGPPV